MKYPSRTKLLLLITLFVLPILLGSIPMPSHAYTSCDGVETNDVILIDYSGVVEGETEPFDAQDDQQFTVKTGQGGVIEGFYRGLLGMKLGERKEIVVPPSQGYQSGELAGETLIFDVFLESIVQGYRECNTGGTGGTAFGNTLANIVQGVFVVGTVGFAGVYGYYYLNKTTTPGCVHCKANGREQLSEGKCAKCGNHYCRQSFSRGCPNCKSNSFVPNT